jgi:hypothetical protein
LDYSQLGSGPIYRAPILLANRDATAPALRGHWDGVVFAPVRQRRNVTLKEVDNASHGFSDSASKEWLKEQVLQALSAICQN